MSRQCRHVRRVLYRLPALGLVDRRRVSHETGILVRCHFFSAYHFDTDREFVARARFAPVEVMDYAPASYQLASEITM